MHRNLVLDMNNISAMIRFSAVKTPSSSQRKEPFVTQLILKEMLDYIGRQARDHKAQAIVVGCDSRRPWRRQKYPDYKAGREPDVYNDERKEATDLAIRFFDECTNARILKVDNTEADDVIAVWCQESEGVENVILSTDKDFEQLVEEGKTSLYSPTKKKFHEPEERDFQLFIKCIRGDKSDNLHSAYPRVRETVLRKAWDDPLEMQNLMETVTKDGHKVGDGYLFNRSMIDMAEIPSDVWQTIRNEIHQLHASRNFNDMAMLRFLTEAQLREHASMMEPYHRILKGVPTLRA